MQPLNAYIHTAYRIKERLDLLVDVGLVLPPHPVPPVDGGLRELQPVSGAELDVGAVNQHGRVEDCALVVRQNGQSGFL